MPPTSSGERRNELRRAATQREREARPQKDCRQCHAQFKPFHKADSFCSKRCRKRFYGAAWQAAYHSDPERRDADRAASRRYYRANPKIFAARSKAYRKKVPHKLREWSLKSNYGLTSAQVIAMGPSCHICGIAMTLATKPGTGSTHRSVDHDHKTGKVRGVLCMGCNHGLGNFKDDPARLLKAIQYLAQHTAKDIEFTA